MEYRGLRVSGVAVVRGLDWAGELGEVGLGEGGGSERGGDIFEVGGLA